MEKSSIYLVKDLASLSGLSAYTIKYYLRLGLIKEIARSPETNFRYFDDTTLDEIRKIIECRKSGMSLARISQELHPGEGV